MTDKTKDFEDEELEETEEEEATPDQVDHALKSYAEEHRGKSGVDPNDHPLFAKARTLLGKMKCR
jgi:hypothetical protein